MISFKDTEVWGFKHAFRGMRNPMNSWDRSDSVFENDKIIIGENDIQLAQKLILGGSEHRKYLRQIFVSVDITAPIYWWKEFDTYKVGTVANSCSTMHKIHAKEFTAGDFSHENLNDYDEYDAGTDFIAIHCMNYIIQALNYHRKKYLETKNKKYWLQMIQLLPSSYNQKRTVTMNYENLLSIYRQRRNHKLNEWSGKDDNTKENFISWISSLPYAEDLIMYGVEKV